MNNFKIRKLERTDAKEFQRLRLFALQNNSTSFGSSFEEEVKKSLEQFEAFIDPKSERVFWGAFESDRLIGMVGLGCEDGVKTKHKGFIRSMFVDPSARKLGVASELLKTAINFSEAQMKLEQLTLAVNSTNIEAINLYKKFRFIEYGVEPNALKIEGRYFAEMLMYRRIVKPGLVSAG
jgi:RimJ/RimL family protein N-acetyltransferase